jgi:hypothetical protein
MMPHPTKDLPPLLGAHGAPTQIDNLVIYCQRLQALVEVVFDTMEGTQLTPQTRNVLRLLGLAIDLMEPMIDHLDALPRSLNDQNLSGGCNGGSEIAGSAIS